MAQRVGVSPLRLSLHLSSVAMGDLLKFAPLASAGIFRKLLEELLGMGRLFVISKHRTRTCPRLVRGKTKTYPQKYASQS